MKLKDKVVLITGATGGIGNVICKRLAVEGAKVAMTSTNERLLLELVNDMKSLNPEVNVIYSVCDVTRESEVEQFIEKSKNSFGSFDLLINLAGLSIPTNYATITEDDYDKMMNVNLKGSLFTSKYFAKYANNPSRIINTGSIAARVVNANAPVYCLVKTAVNKLSEGLLLQLGKQGIFVSTINPGGVDTRFWGERKVDRSKLMSADDVADVYMFVAQLNSNIQLHCVDFESVSKFI